VWAPLYGGGRFDREAAAAKPGLDSGLRRDEGSGRGPWEREADQWRSVSATKAGTPSSTAAVAPVMRVLLVDDTAQVLLVCERCLQRAGIEVCTAEGAAAALELAILLRPDVAVVDVNLTGVSGVELGRALRSTGVRVVLMSGASPPPDAEFDAFLLKPFGCGALVDAIALVRT
jgi:CheY-like chemotaxis protein